VVLFGTGRLLDVPDTTNTDVQSLFALKDSGTALGTIRLHLVQQTLSVLGSTSNSVTYAVTNNPVDLSEGWLVLQLEPECGRTHEPRPADRQRGGECGDQYSVVVVGLLGGRHQQSVPGGRVHRAGREWRPGRQLSSTSAAVGFIIVRLPSGS
jgi:type IV pilus assembly protein PilY1